MRLVIGYALGIFITLSITVVLLFTAVDFSVFMDLDFFRHQYAKNNVYKDVDIDEDELMGVTQCLLDYMKDKKSNLDVVAVVGNEEVEFFNQREKDHMIDVKNLVVTAMAIRRYLFLGILLAMGIMAALRLNLKYALSRCIVFGFPTIACVFSVLGIIISKDFYSAFIKFHELLFTNDLWELYPETDRLINIVPEAFFTAATTRIGIVFAIMIVLVFAVAAVIFLKAKRNRVVQSNVYINR